MINQHPRHPQTIRSRQQRHPLLTGNIKNQPRPWYRLIWIRLSELRGKEIIDDAVSVVVSDPLVAYVADMGWVASCGVVEKLHIG